jgi:cytochrome c peroxidase
MKTVYLAAGALSALSLAGLAFASGAADDALWRQARQFYQPIRMPAVPTKGPKAEQVKLGRMLFHDPRLSRSGIISCNTCHNLARYGTDNLPTSLGHGFVPGPRNSPSVFNAALHARQFWDGRARDVEEQALGPILNPKEMAMPASDQVIERIVSIPEYVAMFRRAFPGQKDPVNYRNVGVAIGAFERMLLTPSRFDRYLAGDRKALTAREKRGLKLFLDTGCASCHAGPAIGGMVFQKFVKPGEDPERADVGRYAVTKDPKDRYVFKAYSLRNVARTYPYLHDGSVWDLGEVVRIMAEVQHNKRLSPTEIAEIVAFLNSLTGDVPAVARELPILPPSRLNTPRPSM